MSTPERLTALDTSFLHAESSRTPMHIAALLWLDGGPLRDADGRVRLDELRTYLASRLHLVPRMRQVVRGVPFGLARPVWVDDVDFDLGHHVRLLELPAPGDRASLLRLTEELMMARLDRSRPLWEWWVIDGLDDGRLALVEKVHHCLIDGVSGVQIMGALSDLAEFAPPEEDTWRPAPPPTAAELLGSAVGDALREPWSLVGDTVRLARHLTRPLRALGGLPRAEPGALRSRAVGPRRRLSPLVLPLSEVKAIGHRHDTKVNDVVLSVVAGGLRALLASRSEPVTGQVFHALVPESIRADHEHLALGNRVGGMFAPLPLDEVDPVARLVTIRDAMRHKRAAHEGEAVSELLDAADHLPPAAVRLLVKLLDEQPFVSTVVTNIPGPREPLSIMGARIEAMVPVVPLAARVTIGVAVLSYLDDLTIAVHSDADAHPDIEVMVEGMRSAFEELCGLSRRRGGRPRRG